MCEQCALFSLVAGKTRDSSFSCGSNCVGNTVVRTRQEPSNRENNSCGMERMRSSTEYEQRMKSRSMCQAAHELILGCLLTAAAEVTLNTAAYMRILAGFVRFLRFLLAA